MRKGQHGMYIYKVYDAKTNELLAEGSCREVASKMNWDVAYPSNLINLAKRFPNAKKRYERVEREWVEASYDVFDKKYERHFIGNYDECCKIIEEWTGYELGRTTLNSYVNSNTSRRFKVKRLKDV